ncbi:MAG: 50S ribosomal protein L25 [Clostridiales bacterium]|jgi:large subunit ribosomal protein L25|nr:50S ribosomal protein L25 [Clostridiales bacterium]
MFLLQAESREKDTKAKQIRKRGFVPGCLYGKDMESTQLLQIKENDALNLLRNKASGNRLVLSVGGTKTNVILRDISNNLVKSTVEHLSFQKLNKDDAVNTAAQIVLVNKEKLPAGSWQQLLYEIPYRSVATEMIEKVEIDVEGMGPGDSVKVSDLDIAKDQEIEILIDQDSLVFSMLRQ